MDKIIKSLTHAPIFENLSTNELEQIVQEAQIINLNPSETIIKQGDHGDSIFIIISGIFEVIKNDDSGSNYLVATLREKDIFGEMSFLTGEPRSCSVISLSPAMVVEITKSQLKPFIEAKPGLLHSLINLMESRIYDNNSTFQPHQSE